MLTSEELERLIPTASRSSPPLWHGNEERYGPNSYFYRLGEACRTGDLDLVHVVYSSWLREQQPDPSTGLVDNKYFLHAGSLAARNNHPTCLAYLFQQGLKVERILVSAAVKSMATRILQVLLDYGWNINEPEAYCEPPFMGHIVKHTALVRWFLEHGADPNAPAGIWDITPLSYAVQRASFDTIKLMFEHGGSTARGQLLNMASGRTDPDCIPILQFLLDQGDAGINNTYFEDRPELKYWSDQGNETPLHHAAGSGNIEAVKWLLDHGADPTKRSKYRHRDGAPPFDAAFYGKHMDIAELLVQATEEIRLRDSSKDEDKDEAPNGTSDEVLTNAPAENPTNLEQTPRLSTQPRRSSFWAALGWS